MGEGGSLCSGCAPACELGGLAHVATLMMADSLVITSARDLALTGMPQSVKNGGQGKQRRWRQMASRQWLIPFSSPVA